MMTMVDYSQGVEESSSSRVPVTLGKKSGMSPASATNLDQGTKNLPCGILNDGYYSRFFIELSCLGSGSFGHVYRCRHTIDEEILGDFAVKKVAVGDDRKWLRKIIREVKTFELFHHP